jgi:antitoxin PrlF
MTQAARVAEFEEFSTVYEKGQTTVPKSVRAALGVSPGDKIAFRVGEGGVSVRRADDNNRDDPAIGAFLSFLAADMTANPSQIKALSPDLRKQISDLIGDLKVDTDAPLDGEIDL